MNYFKYNRHEYYAEYPARLARPVKKDKTREWMFDSENNDAYMGMDHVIPRRGIREGTEISQTLQPFAALS